MKIKSIFSQLIITSILISSWGCVKSNSSANPGNGNPNPNVVSIANFSFSAATTTINNNTTVTWTNNDSSPHTVTADDNSFTSSTLAKGDMYAHTFTTTGTVTYHCNIHTTMKGSVIVK